MEVTGGGDDGEREESEESDESDESEEGDEGEAKDSEGEGGGVKEEGGEEKLVEVHASGGDGALREEGEHADGCCDATATGVDGPREGEAASPQEELEGDVTLADRMQISTCAP